MPINAGKKDGIIYKATWRGYIGNYLIGAGVVVLALLVVTRFDVGFTLSPSSTGELLGTLMYLGFGAVAAFLFLESFIDGLFRHYIVAPTEIVNVKGLVFKKRHAIHYQGVSDINVDKGLMGRIFNYGTLEIKGMNENSIIMRRVENPDEVHRVIRNRIDLSRSPQQRNSRSKKISPPDDDEILDEL